MTLEEMRDYPRSWLTPAQVAEVLGCDAQGLRVWARQKPEALGFPVCLVGHRTKIPRLPFIEFMTGRKTD